MVVGIEIALHVGDERRMRDVFVGDDAVKIKVESLVEFSLISLIASLISLIASLISLIASWIAKNSLTAKKAGASHAGASKMSNGLNFAPAGQLPDLPGE